MICHFAAGEPDEWATSCKPAAVFPLACLLPLPLAIPSDTPALLRVSVGVFFFSLSQFPLTRRFSATGTVNEPVRGYDNRDQFT
jgi:hypothetical protein